MSDPRTPSPDCWKLLGLDPSDATPRDVKAAYGYLVQKRRLELDLDGVKAIHAAYTKALAQLDPDGIEDDAIGRRQVPLPDKKATEQRSSLPRVANALELSAALPKAISRTTPAAAAVPRSPVTGKPRFLPVPGLKVAAKQESARLEPLESEFAAVDEEAPGLADLPEVTLTASTRIIEPSGVETETSRSSSRELVSPVAPKKNRTGRRDAASSSKSGRWPWRLLMTGSFVLCVAWMAEWRMGLFHQLRERFTPRTELLRQERVATNAVAQKRNLEKAQALVARYDRLPELMQRFIAAPATYQDQLLSGKTELQTRTQRYSDFVLALLLHPDVSDAAKSRALKAATDFHSPLQMVTLLIECRDVPPAFGDEIRTAAQALYERHAGSLPAEQKKVLEAWK